MFQDALVNYFSQLARLARSIALISPQRLIQEKFKEV